MVNWGKVKDFLDREKRTMKSRGWLLTNQEMVDGAIIEIINVSSAIDRLEVDDEIQGSIIRQGLYNRRFGTAVLVESAVNSVMGEDGTFKQLRVYSGVVFYDEWHLHLFVLRRRDMYPFISNFSRLVN